MKKVCIIRHYYYPLELNVRREAETLLETGFAVDIICSRKKGQKREENVNGINVFRLPITHKKGDILQYVFGYLAFFILATIKVNSLYLTKKYNVIQVNTMPDFLVFVTTIPKIFGTKVVLHMHEPMPELWETKFGAKKVIINLIKWVEQRAIKYADIVLTVTQQLKDRFISRGADEIKITVILNVPDERVFKSQLANNQIKRNKNCFVLISHGAIEKRYGLDIAIRAIQIVKESINNIKYYILGEGELKNDLIKLVEKLNLQKQVYFPGYLPFNEMIEIIANSDVGVVPIRKNPYSDLIHTNKMFEYIMFNKPVIISRTKAVEDYFNDASLMFFEAGNEKDLARCILELYRNPAKRKLLVANASKVYEKYRWSNMKKEYLKVYQDLAEKK